MASIPMQNLFCTLFTFIGLEEHRNKFIFIAVLGTYKRFAERMEFNSFLLENMVNGFDKCQNVNIKPKMIKAIKKWIRAISLRLEHTIIFTLLMYFTVMLTRSAFKKGT